MPGAEADIDYTQPIAVLLRQGTAKAHEDAENSAGAIALTRGELDKEEYVRFLMMLYYVYSTLERGLDAHADHPTLSPTYNPTLLARTSSLSSDIAHLLQVPDSDSDSSWQSHPLHTALLASPPSPLTAYVSRLKHLAASADPSRLLAHAYVRYLGDLSGGQIIRRRVAKAYGLEEGEEGGAASGTRFYVFGQLGGGKSSAGMGDMRKIKEWYRDGMNAGAGEDVARKMEIVDEAKRAFQLNTDLFTALRPPSARPSPSKPSVSPILGDPTSPPTSPTTSQPFTSSSSSSSPTPHSPLSHPPTSRSHIVGLESPQPSDRTFPLSSILVFCLAVGIAHFTLVVGGFTGERGYGKYQALVGWLEGWLAQGAGAGAGKA